MELRIKSLIDQMTLTEKIGQMVQIDRVNVTSEILRDYSIGSIISAAAALHAKTTAPRRNSGWICLYKATIFPHNVGLGSTRDPELVKKIGAATAIESRATGIPFVFAPCVCRDPRWGRCYESYSEDTQGFVISDWQGVDRMTYPWGSNYSTSLAKAINAGVDMVMVPPKHTEFLQIMTSHVKNNVIPISRIDDAVRRILRVKFTMGLFENPLVDYSLVDQIRTQAHRDLAREAVRKSLVLLKNGKDPKKPLLPLPKKTSKILVAGTHANNLGLQCGGWTVNWQGVDNNTLITGTTILNARSDARLIPIEIVYGENPIIKTLKSNDFSYAIVVVGEHTYAEQFGDNLNLTIPEPGLSTMKNVCNKIKCVVILISGRPLVIEPYLPKIDALVAAWLPGTEGQGVADLLFGDYGFTGKLSRTWFKRVDQLPMNVGDEHYDPLFPFGFGLTTKPTGEILATA
ncbi:hypothetical protein DH2020_026757 [Rehmannia glutinosa]|uniref:beta-glucosidase n=1 Tax=Rehmannia glutinosa TaxID=99300 RepID=A0ABR0VZW1_REHGL